MAARSVVSPADRSAVLGWLTESGRIDAAAVARAEAVAERTGQPIEQVLNQLGNLSDEDLAQAYAKVLGCEIWEPQQEGASFDLASLPVSKEFLRRSRILPVGEEGGVLRCAVCDPLDLESHAGLTFATGRSLKILVGRPAEWKREFEARLGEPEAAAPLLDRQRIEREADLVTDWASEGPGARLVALAFEAAVAMGASDIHFEPTRHELKVRLRVDGRLIDHDAVSIDLAAQAVSRVKVIANLNLGERRLPQDGRTTFVVQGRRIDVRVATAPTVFGESAVLRILDRSAVPLDLESLGLSDEVVSVLQAAAGTAHGLFLVTGPTGSGKTTTLYALLQTFAGSGKKVLSVEDPVEYHFEHVSQTQVAPAIGLTFASALRSFLRHDPDVILVGEIRDPETAAVAIQAAMTGHLVLASIHANSAAAVVPRLRDMGVERYQLTAGFRGAVAQRLVRRLCVHCRERVASTPDDRELARSIGSSVSKFLFAPKGCAACGGVGFKGRFPISEGFRTTEADLSRIIQQQDSGDAAADQTALRWRTMVQDGLAKAITGETTLAEVLSAVHA